MEYKKLPVDELKPNNYNPNEMTDKIMSHLVAEIKRVGFLQPILVNKKGIIIDGEHRWLAAKETKLKEVPVIEIDMDEQESKVTTVNMNSIKGELNPLKFAELLKDLKLEYNLDDLSSLFNLSMAELESYEILLDLPSDIRMDTSEKKVKTATCPECGHDFEL